MQLMLNDLSLTRSFHDKASFLAALGSMIKMRAVAKQHGRDIYCHRSVASALIIENLTIQQAVQGMERDHRLAILTWLQRTGPFWDDEATRQHSGDDYLEFEDEVVTDTGLGEAAVRTWYGAEHHTVSLHSSPWCQTPLMVRLVQNGHPPDTIPVVNHWAEGGLKTALEAAPPIVNSWERLAEILAARYTRLTFLPDCFTPLHGVPFVSAAAQRIQVLCKILDDFCGCFDENGQRTAEGNRLYGDFFMDKGGDGKAQGKAAFTDSSDSEKNEFHNEMIFPHPDTRKKPLFCTWHGKIRASQMRMHFSWPVRAKEDLYIAYIGPKLTKR
jgi:hypothetical protein